MTDHRTIGPEVAPTQEPRTPSSTRLGRAVGVATAALLLAGGGIFATGQLTSATNSEGGATTPEGAVDAMLTSLEQNDLIGVVDHLAPGERDVFRDATNDYVQELTRLGVLGETIDLQNVSGFEISFDSLTYDVEQANARVSLVGINGGQVTVGVNAVDLPLGQVIVDRVGELPKGTETVTIDLAEELSGVDEVPRIAVVEESGRYYVSSFYTVAELAAAENGFTMPDTPIPAVGAASPEEAVQQLVEASVDLDVARMIELTPPDEMAALHDYGPILVELAEEAIAENGVDAQLEGFDISVDRFEFETVEVSGGIKVLPTHIAISVESDEVDAAGSFTKVDETCVEFEFEATITLGDQSETEGEAGRLCAADIRQAFADVDVPPEIEDIAERMVAQLGQIGAIIVEVDGEWYLSPARSYTDLGLVILQGLESSDLETLIDFAESWLTLDVELD